MWWDGRRAAVSSYRFLITAIPPYCAKRPSALWTVRRSWHTARQDVSLLYETRLGG